MFVDLKQKIICVGSSRHLQELALITISFSAKKKGSMQLLLLLQYPITLPACDLLCICADV